jgi:hypothetical protein
MAETKPQIEVANKLRPEEEFRREGIRGFAKYFAR